MIFRPVLLVTALLLSAFFSGCETAMLGARRIKLEIWAKHGMRRAKDALAMVENPERTLVTLLVGTNIANVLFSSLMAMMFTASWSGWTITAVSSLAVLILGEIIPKSLATDRATLWTARASYVLRFFYALFYPLVRVSMEFSRLMMRRIGLRYLELQRFLSRREIEALVREGHKYGVVNYRQRELILNFILKGNQKVRDLMIPRTEITAVRANTPVSDIVSILIKTGYSRLPVFGKDLDDIRGFIMGKDILVKKPRRIRSIIRDILFVPESRGIASFLKEMQEAGIGAAIVVDEYGGTAGFVTIEDIVEAFFGDIQDEHDEVDNLFRKVTPNQIDVLARIEIRELNERFHLGLPEGGYQTLSGLIQEELGHIPRPGEKIDLPDCTVAVLTSTRKSVGWVRVSRKT
ncbi:HlyC/CorC family transporter [bacterium]|nr:HlyC/CorC family transporter [bacterium]